MKSKIKSKLSGRQLKMLRPKSDSHLVERVAGDELIEAITLAGNPDARSRDILLLRAKRAKTKLPSLRDTKLSDSELRGVSWFAHVPEFRGDLTQAIYNEGNFLASSFWAIWKREPATVWKLVEKIRESWPLDKTDDLSRKKVEAVVAKQAKLNYKTKTENAAKKFEAEKRAVSRDRKQLKPSENVTKFAARLSQGS